MDDVLRRYEFTFTTMKPYNVYLPIQIYIGNLSAYNGGTARSAATIYCNSYQWEEYPSVTSYMFIPPVATAQNRARDKDHCFGCGCPPWDGGY